MPTPIRTPAKIRLSPLQAVKRACLHRGLMLGNNRPETTSQPKSKVPAAPPNEPAQNSDRLGSEKKIQEDIKQRGQEAEKEGEEGPQKLIEATEKSHEVLFRAETVFPFTLFPDHVTLDREKLTIAHRDFIKTAKIITVPVQDLLSVEADIGPFFGSVHTSSRFFVTSPHTVNFLKRDDAVKLQRLLQGYIIAVEQSIDCSTIEIDELKTLLIDLGQGAPD